MKIHLNRSQDLSYLIVQLARWSPPFVLLGLDELPRKHLQCVLRKFAFRDIPRYALNSDHDTVLIDRTATNLNRHPTTILCYHVDFEGSFTLFSESCVENFAAKRKVRYSHKFDKVMTNNFVLCVS